MKRKRLSSAVVGKGKKAIQKIFALTQQLVIVTLGADGSMAYDGKQLVHVPAFPCKVVDCVGAGDAHAGCLPYDVT